MTSSPPPSSVMAAFDLPAMPPSFEDFQFSLNLPENITASDFNLVSSPDFGNLFGMTSMGSGGPFTPSALIASSDSTPKGTGLIGGDEAHDDTIMTSSSRRPSISSALGLGFESQMTSMPMSSNMAPQQPAAASAEPTLTFQEYMARSGMSAFPQQAAPMAGGASAASKSLFDANEANFLTNFLQGFEGWDFNPSLPIDLPSFADAERGAYAYGMPPALPSAQDYRRNARKSTNGSKGKSSPSAAFSLSQTTSPSSHRIESSAGAAFGRPMADWNEDDDDEDSQRDARGRRKSTHHALDDSAAGKKIKVEHADYSSMQPQQQQQQQQQQNADSSKRDLLSDHEKRQNHILSEQRRRNHIREAFKELVDLLEAGREFGARGLGMSSGAGTGVEDEGLDDRSDYESTLEDEEPSAAVKRRKAKAKRKAAMEAILSSGGRAANGSAATRGRGKGRGRGGSAGGGAGSKSAVLFQAVDLLRWLDGRNQIMERQVQELEEAAPAVKAA